MKLFNLQGRRSSLIIGYKNDSTPQIMYWGEKLIISDEEAQQILKQNHAIPLGTIDQPSYGSVLPTLSEGDFQLNAIEIISDTRWSPKFKVKDIIEQENSLSIILNDEIANLEARVCININEFDIVQKKIILKNTSDEKIIVSKLLNTLILPSEINQITQYHGRWVQEGQELTSSWDQPNYIVENLRGRTSHDNPSILRVQQLGCNNNNGQCYGFSLAWSGNHNYILRKLDNDNKSLQWGEKLISNEITLGKNESYTTPILFASYSNQGFNGLRHNWHNFIRIQEDLAKHTRKTRPIQINTWEAIYFDHNIDLFKKMIDKAAELGIERFVLDDGWFKGRNNEKAGLGDWFVDTKKYPKGLHPLVNYTLSKGLEFGLWFEPEMINPDSDLFRANPEWILAIDN